MSVIEISVCCSSMLRRYCDVHLCVVYENSISLGRKYKETPRYWAKTRCYVPHMVVASPLRAYLATPTQ